jgi:GLPGLI family protein
MKLFLVFSLVSITTIAVAQPKLISEATITTSTNVIAPEDDELQNVQNQGQGGGMAMFRNFGDGETKATTYLKNDMVKTVVKTDMGRTTIIRNNATKITTTLLEIMGNKTGFYVSDDEQLEMRKKMDSAMQARKKDSSATRQEPRANTPSPTEVSVTDETKKIAGYVCKKAYIITTHILGLKDSVTVWFTPDIKLQNISATGGLTGFGNTTTPNGFDKIDGFIMGYERNVRRNRHMVVQVTKIDTSKDIADKEFDIPKDFDVKPMKDMQGMPGMGGGFRMMIRGNH